MRTNYVIACWSGNRRRKDVSYDTDRSFYLRAQVEALTRLNHDLDQITFVVNNDPRRDTKFEEYLAQIPEKIKETTVKILRRPNIGISYGAWAHAYETYKAEFDYYIIIEDDYIPNLDGFDEKLIKNMHEQELDYVCGYYTDHAAASSGLFFRQTVDAMYARRRPLPYCRLKNGSYGQQEMGGQVAFSRAFTDLGYKAGDYTNEYLTVFETLGSPHPKYMFMGDMKNPAIIIPIEYLKEQDQDVSSQE